MTLNQLTANIVGWANDRNLIEGSDFRAQCIKLGEELGETAEAFEYSNIGATKDGIGDCYVVATIMAVQLGGSITRAREDVPIVSAFGSLAVFGRVCGAVARGKKKDALDFLAMFINTLESEANDNGIDLTECVVLAWETIKDRKGRMVDGVFIKEGE